MNLEQQEQFYQFMNRVKANSKAASVPKDNETVTEVMNGLIVTRPAKKIEYIGESRETEPIVIDLQKSKAGSVPVNKLQEILRFQRSNGRY